MLPSSDESRLAPSPKATVDLLRAKGHTVICRRLESGSWRFKMDQFGECSALALSNRYRRLYERG